jgi:hypothetical protein
MAFERAARALGVFVCDVCGETVEITEDLDNHKECWSHAREQGWEIKSGEHYCSDCAGLKS